MAEPQKGQRRPYYNPLESVVERLLSTNEKLVEQIATLSLEIARLKGTEQSAPVAMEVAPYPLHVPEDEEDEAFLASHGLLNPTELEDVLAEAGFSNTQITNAW